MLKDIEGYIVIDFDSTFVKLEALEVLAQIVLENDPQKEAKVKEIEEITKRGMQGSIDFTESLSKRLNIFSPNRGHVNTVVEILKNNVSERFLGCKEYIQENSGRIFIVSGGFKELILPVTREFGIKDNHVFSNDFVWDNDRVIGFESGNPLSKSGGKVEILKNLEIDKDNVVSIGDGYTDYEMKEKGLVEKFYYFSDNVQRKSVMELADEII